MFAAQAGAKHVYGIDMSDIITDAREIIRLNGFQDKITLIQGKVEQVELPVRVPPTCVPGAAGTCCSELLQRVAPRIA